MGAQESCKACVQDKADAGVEVNKMVKTPVAKEAVEIPVPVLKESTPAQPEPAKVEEPPPVKKETPVEQPAPAKVEPAPTREISPVAAITDLKDGRKRFTVELVREGAHWSKLGLLVSPDDDPSFLVIDDVVGAPNLMDTYNQTADDSVKVRSGHRIVSVNGQSGNSEQMLERIQESGQGSKLTFEIETPPA